MSELELGVGFGVWVGVEDGVGVGVGVVVGVGVGVGVDEAAGVDFITTFESELSRLPLYANHRIVIRAANWRCYDGCTLPVPSKSACWL